MSLIELANPADTYAFKFVVGDRRALVLELAQTGVIDLDEARRLLRPAWRQYVADLWRRFTRWWRPRMLVSAVDVAAGTITTDMQRWSWRHWRWEP